MSGSALIVVPVLRRPHRVEPLFASIVEATPEPHRVLFVGTEGDTAQLDAVRSVGADLEVLPPNPVGDYARKINRALAISDEPYLFTGADDLRFHPGWLTAALRPMADPRIGIVGTQDLAPTERARTGQHATHFLVRRTYALERGTIDERGKIFHEGYPHEYVDDELVGTARKRGAWAFAGDAVVEHLHPHWGKADTDALYDAQAERMAAGRKIYRRRRWLWR